MKTRVGIAVAIAALAVTTAAVATSSAAPARPTAPAGTSGSGIAVGAPTVAQVASHIACPAETTPCPPFGGAPGAPNTVTVTGTGTVTSQPDEAVLGMGVRTQASDAADALQENATRMTAVLKALQDLGIKSADIVTTSVMLNPNYSNDGSSITGYVVENDISVTL